MTLADFAKFVIWLVMLFLTVSLGTWVVDALFGAEKTLFYSLLGYIVSCIFYAKIANLFFRPIERHIDSVGK